MCVCVCVCGEAFSLEPQGNDFTSSGQLGFLLIQTMSGCGALNIERRVNEKERKNVEVEDEEIQGEGEKEV